MTQPAPPPPPLQASDPARLTDGQIVPRYAPPPAPITAFRFDPERAPQILRGLEVAERDLMELRAGAVELGKVIPPASDSVSADAASLISTTAVGGQGSLADAISAGLTELARLKEALRADAQAYERAEHENVAPFNQA